jgi:VWFA-related protein
MTGFARTGSVRIGLAVVFAVSCLQYFSATASAQATPPVPQQPTAAPIQTPGQTPTEQPALKPQEGDQPTFTLRARAYQVDLTFSVTDRKGRFVTGLKLGDFALLDDGRPPAAVVAFKQLSNLPLRVGIMLDTSSSIRTRFKFEQDSAVDFFLQVLHADDRAFVEGFDVQTYLSQDYTQNIDLLDQGIHKLRPGGGTALYDSLYKTCRDQMLTLKPDLSVRKALILVSDGDDNYSRSNMTDAIKMCQRAETIVYTISTDTSPTRGKGGDVLEAISHATGGQTFFPTKMEDVALGFRDIETELRSQYSLEYRPAEFTQDGSFRTILLRAVQSNKYTVRARTGYFAPRPQQ